ncbi:MAG: cytochrome c3 family protein, partial [Gammaproteobacteria bacterium]|nr:cytochrome c3 family protein [Gammaproteobacteria bacterium]
MGWLFAACLWVTAPVLALEDEQCLRCHSRPDMTGDRGGEEISMFVAEDAGRGSVHAGMACVDCHTELAGTRRRRHAEELEFVDCGACHEAEAVAQRNSLHGAAAARGDPMAPSCADCHGKHDILSASDSDAPTAVMSVPLLCG